VVTRAELVEFHEELMKVSILFLQNSQDIAETQWRELCVGYLERRDLAGAYRELDRMREAAPDTNS
jgi:hypothetical protein